MRTTRWAFAALFPLSLLPLAGCGSVVAASPGAAYSSVTGAASASASATAGGGRADGAGKPATMIPARTMLTVRKTPEGYVLATAAGRTVYTYSEDRPGSGKSSCASGCLSAWPAVTGRPFAASGVRLAAALGMITWPDGTVQATYGGHPLYTYAADPGPGQASGDGEGGVWHAVRVAGQGG